MPRPSLSLAFTSLLLACSGGQVDSSSGLSAAATLPPLTTASAASSGGETQGMSEGTGSSGQGATGSSGAAPTGGAEGSSGGAEGSSGGGSGGEEPGPPPAVKVCAYPAAGGPGLLELMVPKGSAERLKFVVPGLPDPASVTRATLRYRSYDADHPGEEGQIFVNAGAPIAMPADAAWENAEQEHALEITGATIAGDNTVEFGAGSFAGGTFYRVGQVTLEVEATLEACPEPPPPPAEARQLGFEDAVYTERHNWVLRCDFLDGYAFTAKGDQAMLDCGKMYAPDGTTHGKATFVFTDVAPGEYLITIKSRHTVNRNKKGALFTVNGEARRIHQDDDKDFWVDTWGTKALAGEVTVVLDSTMEIASDSVTWVRLEPL